MDSGPSAVRAPRITSRRMPWGPSGWRAGIGSAGAAVDEFTGWVGRLSLSSPSPGSGGNLGPVSRRR